LGAVLPEEIRENLAPYEVQWFVHYCDTLAEYMSRLNEQKGLDLTLYRNAPKCLYVQVRCLLNYGDFELDDGTVVVLSPGSMVSYSSSFTGVTSPLFDHHLTFT
jgi:GINS complex subunit 1